MGIAQCTSCANDLALFQKPALSSAPAAAASTPPKAAARGSIPPPAANKTVKPSALAMMAMRNSSPNLKPEVKPEPKPLTAPKPPRANTSPQPAAAPPPAAPPPAAPRSDAAARAGGRSGNPASIDDSPKAAAPVAAAAASASAPLDFSKMSQEELMEQAKSFVCRSCSSAVPSGHKFCGRCGAAVPPEILNAQTLFFGDMQNPAKAKLILIRGEGMDGLSFHLKAEQHVVGRDGQLVFPDDPFVSRRHANFFYRDGRLVVRDEGSLNGVYIRVRGTVDLTPGDTFLVGEQLFRLETTPHASDGQNPDGTYFYSSPKHPSPFRLAQILQGGAIGMTVCARSSSLLIGREGGDLNFPVDLYMSGAHCRIDEADGKFALTDLSSRNGTYLRIKTERDLSHGDYLFIGRKLLRVELNTN
ncbi:MAG: FHA domain-containing protein [Polyangiaceae bacterium]